MSDAKIAALFQEAEEATHPLRAIRGWDDTALGELIGALPRALRDAQDELAAIYRWLAGERKIPGPVVAAVKCWVESGAQSYE